MWLALGDPPSSYVPFLLSTTYSRLDPCFAKIPRDFEASSLVDLVFRGTCGSQFHLISTLFCWILTYCDLFCHADLTSFLRESPSTITIMNCTSRWTSGWTSRCEIRYGYGAISLPERPFKHWDGHLDDHPDVHLDVQFIMVVVLGLSRIFTYVDLFCQVGLTYIHLFPPIFIEFFRGRPQGGTTLLHFSKCSRPFIQSVKSTLSYLKTCNPVGGTPSSTAWFQGT